MTPFYSDRWLTIYEGHATAVLATLEAGSAHMAVTSPPYWGLRDYDTPAVTWNDGWVGQLGLEPDPDQYVTHLVEIFAAVRRVLREDATLWVNIGDSYSRGDRATVPVQAGLASSSADPEKYLFTSPAAQLGHHPVIKSKDMIGIPWMLAFALRADGWYLRSDIIWAKPNVMPESVTDRPTKAHEYLFLLTKSPTYYYDEFAIREPLVSTPEEYLRAGKSVRENHAFGAVGGRPLGDKSFATVPSGRNKRTVWTVTSQPYSGAHYAPFPPKLVEPAVLAGTSEKGVCARCGSPYRRVTTTERSYDHTTTDPGKQEGGPYANQTNRDDGHDIRHGVYANRTTDGWEPGCDHDGLVVPAVVLDPFAGSGTTGMVAQQHSRRAILIDLNGSYLAQQLVRNANIPLGL